MPINYRHPVYSSFTDAKADADEFMSLIARHDNKEDMSAALSKYSRSETPKAIITLTTWAKRINLAYVTIYSLLRQGNDYRIILVLSTDEFPNKVVPKSIALLNKYKLIEILWVKRNIRMFKKLLPTIKYCMDNGLHLPIITCDDDCVYSFSMCDDLMRGYSINGTVNTVFVWKVGGYRIQGGCGTLYPPTIFGKFIYLATAIFDDDIIATNADDEFYAVILRSMGISPVSVYGNESGYETIRIDSITQPFIPYAQDVRRKATRELPILRFVQGKMNSVFFR